MGGIGRQYAKVAVAFGHEHGMEVFWSYRMNNIEDSFAAWSLTRWKREHPEYCIGKAEDWAKYPYTDPRKWWAGLDYAVPEVRSHFLAIIGVGRRGKQLVEGMALDEVAQTLDMPLGSVKSTIHRCRKRLRDLLEESA